MKTANISTVALALASSVLAGSVSGAEVYQVNASVPSGGIDLVGGGYAADALKGPSSAAWVAVTGTVTHASGLSAAHPFAIDLPAANAKLTLKESGLLGSVPVRVTGPGSGTVSFDGDTLNVDESTDASVLSWKSVNLQVDNLTVSSKTGPAAWHCTNNAPFYVRYNTRIGCDGGTGTVVMNQTGLGRTNTSEDPGLGQRGTANIFLGDSSASGLGVSSGTLQIKNGGSSAWNVYLGSANVADPGDGSAGTPNVIQMDGGSLTFLYLHMRGSLPAKIAFNGGRIQSHGWGTFLDFGANTSGDLILEGQNGKPIDVGFNKFAQFVTWGSGATGRLVFRGDSDVYLYGGDYNTSHTYAQQCLEGSQFRNRADGQGFVWEQTGDLYFKPSYQTVILRCLIQSDNVFPHGPANGGVVVATSASLFTVDLMGTTQNCNSLFGGGLVTNTSPETATLNIGENNNNCQFDVRVCANSPVDVNKLGTGEITVAKPIPGTFTVQAGRAAVTDASGAVTFGALSMAEGTVLSVRGGVFTPPASFDLTASGTGSFELLEGGVLRVGGDADATLDLSRVTSDVTGVIEKTGTGTLTLTGASAFRGVLRVTAGTASVAEGASMGTLASVVVADGATLDLASGVALNAYALNVRGTAGVRDASYSGSAAGAQPLAGLTGAGTVAVVASTALWTGAVDDDATKVGNWQGVPVAPDVAGGSFNPVFAAASANGGKLDVGVGYAFNGISFTSDVTAFTFKSLGADASLGLGTGGLTLPDDAATRTVTFDTPLAVAAGNQTWTVPANATLNVNGPLADASAAAVSKVTVTGAGKAYFRSANSTYTGSVVVDADQAYAYGDEPFGPADPSGAAEVRVMQRSGDRLTMSNVRISKKVVVDFSKGSGLRQSIGYAPNTTNVYYGPYEPQATSAVDAFRLPASSTVIFAGGYGTPDKKFYINWGTEGTVVISNKPMCGTTWECGARKLHLYCPGNTYGGMATWSNNQLESYDPYNPVPVNVDFFCDWGFDLPTSKTCIYGTWDLHGHSQRVGAFYANASAVIRSFDGPATFHVNQHKWHANYPYISGSFPKTAYPIPASKCAIQGEVSLYKTGPLELGFADRVIEATGTVTVAEGPLTLWAGASWPNATNVVVSGGTFRLTQPDQLGRDTDYHLESGTLQLDADAHQKAHYLWLDGAEAPIRSGIWGSLENTSLPASRRTARITGTGTLNVRGDGTGCVLVIR